jgi:hypothetical protein
LVPQPKMTYDFSFFYRCWAALATGSSVVAIPMLGWDMVFAPL